MSQPHLSATSRQSEHEILDVILHRWSPRAMTGEALSESGMQRLFEAARWAPSSSNEQPWRFLYALNGSTDWSTFFGLLAEGNQTWCLRAAALIVVISKKTFSRNGTPNPTHSLDTGMAVQNLLLETAATQTLVGHAMGGFDRTRARLNLAIPDEYNVECMIAVGHAGKPELLPSELLAREVPSLRKSLTEIVTAGKFA